VTTLKPTRILLGPILALAIALSFAPHADAATEKLNRKQMYDRCMNDVRVVTHRSNRVRSGPDVDTKAWIRLALSRNRWIEEDLQRSGSPKPTGWMFHDVSLNYLTNGTRRVTQRTNHYLSRLHTVHHNVLAPYDWFLMRFVKDPSKWAQLEWKNYNGQFTPAVIQALYQQQVDLGVEDHIYDSSHWPSVLRTLEKIDPSIYTQLIGFGNQQPSLEVATDSQHNGEHPFDQVNVNYVAAFRPYGNYSHYARAVLAKGLKLSIRSNPNGDGDNVRWWRREIQVGATALVVQGHGKQYVCDAVRG
jgi:hypothetical protein